MDCPYCKYPLEDGAAFCSECGRELPDAASLSEGDGDFGLRDVSREEAPSAAADLSAGSTEFPGLDLPPLPEAKLPDAGMPGLPPLKSRPLRVPPMPKAARPVPPPLGEAKPAAAVREETARCERDDGNPFILELDTMLPLHTGEDNNAMRILFSPAAGTGEFSDVAMALSTGGGKEQVKKISSINKPHEFKFGVSGLKSGVCVCDLSVSYEMNGRRQAYESTFEVVVRKERDLKSERNLSFIINQHIHHISEASRVRSEIPEEAIAALDRASRNPVRDPLGELNELVNRGVRNYRRLSVVRSDGAEDIPPPPQEAICGEIQLDFGRGFGKIQFFSDLMLSVGHASQSTGKRMSDISVDPPDGLEEELAVPYREMSHVQCRIINQGEKVEIADGYRRSNGILRSSTNGTFLDGEKIGGDERHLPGVSRIGLGGQSAQTTLDATLHTPSPETCRRCRLAGDGREYCCPTGSARANAVLRRCDGVNVVYVALWSCIDVGSIYGAFAGLEILRNRGAFAWRRGKKRGWLVPGERIKLSDLSAITVSGVWSENKGDNNL